MPNAGCTTGSNRAWLVPGRHLLVLEPGRGPSPWLPRCSWQSPAQPRPAQGLCSQPWQLVDQLAPPPCHVEQASIARAEHYVLPSTHSTARTTTHCLLYCLPGPPAVALTCTSPLKYGDRTICRAVSGCTEMIRSCPRLRQLQPYSCTHQVMAGGLAPLWGKKIDIMA